MSEPKVYTKKLSEFKPDIHNANKHTQRGRGMVERSQRERGFARPGFAANDGTILGGNLSLGEVGAEVFGVDSDVIVIETDGTKPIIHLRTDLDPDSPQAIQLALEDNRTAEVSLAWDADVLMDIDARDDVDLGDWWFEGEKVIIGLSPEPDIDYDALWQGMPEFEHKDLTAKTQLIVNFNSWEDYSNFAELIDQKLTEQTRSIWYPERPKELQDQLGTKAGLIFSENES